MEVILKTSMHFNPRLAGVICASSVLFVGTAFGQKPTVTVEIKGVDGRPAKAAEVRIERMDRKTPAVTVKTDARGHMAPTVLSAGTYKMTATSPEGAKSFQVFTTDASKPLLFTFDMKPLAGSNPANPKKRVYVWVDTPTGTHLGGHYEELDGSARARRSSGLNVDKISSRALDDLTRNHDYIRPAVVP